VVRLLRWLAGSFVLACWLTDPESLVGFDVSIMWANKWYDGTVLRYNAASDRHLVRYHEDSEQAWYNLHRKTHFVKGPAAPGWRSLAHDPKLDADERKLPPHPSHEAEILDGDSSIEQRRLRYANHRQAVGGGMALSPATARPKAAETESRP